MVSVNIEFHNSTLSGMIEVHVHVLILAYIIIIICKALGTGDYINTGPVTRGTEADRGPEDPRTHVSRAVLHSSS